MSFGKRHPMRASIRLMAMVSKWLLQTDWAEHSQVFQPHLEKLNHGLLTCEVFDHARDRVLCVLMTEPVGPPRSRST